ncbi:MAG: hypothetical protein AABY22_23970 [Nanoarchaeota archaeon]
MATQIKHPYIFLKKVLKGYGDMPKASDDVICSPTISYHKFVNLMLEGELIAKKSLYTDKELHEEYLQYIEKK